MALKKSEPVKTTLEEETSLSPNLLSQLQSNFSSTPADNLEPAEASTTTSSSAKTNTKKPDYKNIFNLHLATGDKSRLKAFCAEREVPINTFILFAIDHLIDDIEEGKCTVSKSGVRTLRKEV